MSRTFHLAIAAALLLGVSHAHAADVFSLHDEPGQHLDVRLGGRTLARYMYAFDKSAPQRLLETYKPYLHVFDPTGQTPITKGPGGGFPHHRAIFIGWNKTRFGGKTYDFWHMKDVQQAHQKFLAQQADGERAEFTALIHWNDPSGKPVLEEERSFSIRRVVAPAYALIDFATKLKAPNGDVELDGDPEHAGVQFRPASELDTTKTVYAFPKEGANPRKDLDYPWVGETYTLGGKRYSVALMNHPTNPKGTKYSAYRDYGRFGAFFVKAVKAGESLSVKYRFLVAEGEMPPAEFIQASYNAFAGASDPTPKLTVTPADKPAPPRQKPGEKAP
ncbi:MAG: hypothetical protein FJ279_19540 [Planctomycetes bacterium]|nr:hypothetical protein [Planctomycetota bacterium]